MSRYYVFTDDQLINALNEWMSTQPGRGAEAKAVLDFLNSDISVKAGMARDLTAPAAPEISVFPAAGTSESISKDPTL